MHMLFGVASPFSGDSPLTSFCLMKSFFVQSQKKKEDNAYVVIIKSDLPLKLLSHSNDLVI